MTEPKRTSAKSVDEPKVPKDDAKDVHGINRRDFAKIAYIAPVVTPLITTAAQAQTTTVCSPDQCNPTVLCGPGVCEPNSPCIPLNNCTPVECTPYQCSPRTPVE